MPKLPKAVEEEDDGSPSEAEIAKAREILARAGETVLPARKSIFRKAYVHPARKAGGGRFKLLVGSHTEGGREYSAGDVIDSPVNLTMLFGRNKFAPMRAAEKRPLENRTQGGGPLPTVVKEGLPEGQDELDRDTSATAGNPDEVESDDWDGQQDESNGDPNGDETLNSMTVADLKKMAKSERIDLGGATTKADIISAIQSGKAASASDEETEEEAEEDE